MSAWTSSSLFSCNFVAELSFFFHTSLSRDFLHHISMRLQLSSRNSSIIFHPLSFFHICHQCAISQAFFSRCHLHSAHNSCEPSSSLSSQPSSSSPAARLVRWSCQHFSRRACLPSGSRVVAELDSLTRTNQCPTAADRPVDSFHRFNVRAIRSRMPLIIDIAI